MSELYKIIIWSTYVNTTSLKKCQKHFNKNTLSIVIHNNNLNQELPHLSKHAQLLWAYHVLHIICTLIVFITPIPAQCKTTFQYKFRARSFSYEEDYTISHSHSNHSPPPTHHNNSHKNYMIISNWTFHTTPTPHGYHSRNYSWLSHRTHKIIPQNSTSNT